VVRNRDRATQDLISRLLYLGPWQARWKSYLQMADEKADPERDIYTQRSSLEDEKKLQLIDTDVRRFFMTLLFNYSPSNDKLAANIWDQLMRFGLPITLWPRNSLDNTQQAELCEMLKECTLRALPQRIKTRRNSATSETSLGKQLVLLWDDPDRLAQEGARFENPT